MDSGFTLTDVPTLGIGTVVNHRYFGRGRIAGYDKGHYVGYFKGEMKKVPYGYGEMEAEGAKGDPALDLIKKAVAEVLGDHGWIDADIEMGQRWHGGTMTLVPGNEDTQSKEIPLEAFFKKIIGIREKLRVLEQKINNHKTLAPEDKLELEGYITRCYGSLTTFNVLFADKRAHFKGSGG